MHKLSDNYYQRKCYFEREQVPTQSVMLQKMGPPLANVYFKSMTYKLRVLAGLDPPLKGAGNDWFVPPAELLKGRTVMKPTKKSFLKKLGSEGIILFGELTIPQHRRSMERETQIALEKVENDFKRSIAESSRRYWEEKSKIAAESNTLNIQFAFQEFTNMYSTSLTNIESLLFDAATEEIHRMKREAHEKMEKMLAERTDYQAKKLYDYYTNKLDKEKERQKNKFTKKLEMIRAILAMDIHDMRVERHLIVEKLRHLLQSQNLACQVYVAIKEKEACMKEMEQKKGEHNKAIKYLKEQIAMKDFEILIAQEKEKKGAEFNTIWQKKVCEVVKKLQMFISFCLRSLPEYADFFIDMEKLMLLHLNDVIDNPQAESVFEPDHDDFHTPVPRPHPFYLVCDKGNKPMVEQDLCPKHCTSSASHMPVVVVNKRCIYAACDNFEEFTSKVTQFLHGRRGDESDFADDHDYRHDVPVKYTSREQIEELKLESSLLQIFQTERPNVNAIGISCCRCGIPHCFCKYPTRKEDGFSTVDASKDADSVATTSKASPKSGGSTKKQLSRESIDSGIKIQTRSVELMHEREPKVKDYLDYILPIKCKCAKSVKKHLAEHLPPYMTVMSKYEQPEFPNYEMCTVETLRKLVKKAQGKMTHLPTPPTVTPTHREVATQYSNQEFDELCTCFSDDEVDKIFKEILKGEVKGELEKATKLVGDITPSDLAHSTASFVTTTAHKLRNIVQDSKQLQEIFMKKDCKYD